MTTKKSKSTKSKTAKATKLTIEGKAIGRNVILIIGGEKYSKAIKEKADREDILAKVDAYNKRNSLKKEREIIEIMLKGKTTAEERKKAAKAPKPKVKKAPKVKPAPVMSIAEAKKLLEKDGFTVTKEAPASRKSSYRREH